MKVNCCAIMIACVTLIKSSARPIWCQLKCSSGAFLPPFLPGNFLLLNPSTLNGFFSYPTHFPQKEESQKGIKEKPSEASPFCIRPLSPRQHFFPPSHCYICQKSGQPWQFSRPSCHILDGIMIAFTSSTPSPPPPHVYGCNNPSCHCACDIHYRGSGVFLEGGKAW